MATSNAPLPAKTPLRPATVGHIAALAAILLAALAAYHNSFGGPFIFDDPGSITDNPTIRNLWSLGTVLRPPADGSAVARRPVANLSVAINYALVGTEVWGYHLFNLMAHMAAAWTLFGVVRRTLLAPLLRETFGSAAAALALASSLLWATHPVLTNAVTYVIQRTEVLAGLFYLLTLYCTIRGGEARHPWAWHVPAILSCLLAMGSKESAFSAPVVVLLYDRIFLARSWREALRRRWGLYLGLAATWGITAWMMARQSSTFGQGPGVAPWTAADWWDYASIQPQSITWYLRLSFWPDPLILDYGTGEPRDLRAAAPYALLMLALLCGTVAALRYRPALGFLGVWFFAILAPSSGLVPITSECAAEKRMYLPLAAVVVLALSLVYLALRRLGQGVGERALVHPQLLRVFAGMAVLSLTAAFVAASVRRNEDYRSDLAIWQDNAEKRPGNPRAQFNCGVMLKRQGRIDDAIARYREALRLCPDYAHCHNNLGSALMTKNAVNEATAHFQEAIRLDPKYVEPYNNLANVWLHLGRAEAAVPLLERALQLKPDHAEAHNNMGVAAVRRGESQEAVRHFEKALHFKPDLAQARENLADALMGCDGRAAEGVAIYEQLLKQAPANVHLCLRLAWLLATRPLSQGGDPVKAIAWAEQACEWSGPGQPNCLDVLAAAYAAQGRFSEAVCAAERAMQLASAAKADDFAREIEGHLAFYRQQRPYRASRSTISRD